MQLWPTISLIANDLGLKVSGASGPEATKKEGLDPLPGADPKITVLAAQVNWEPSKVLKADFVR